MKRAEVASARNLLMATLSIDGPEYILLRDGQAVAQWTAEEAWGDFVEALLKRIGLPVQTVDADPTVLSFMDRLEALGMDDFEWDYAQMLERIIALFGVKKLGKPLEPEEIERLKREKLVGGQDVSLRFRS